MGVHCDHMVHPSADLSLQVYVWIVQCSGHRDTKARPPTPGRLFPVPPGREVGYATVALHTKQSGKPGYCPQ